MVEMTTATVLTPPSTMTSRERILAVLRGEEVDRFPVWLKMGAAWRKPQPEPYRGMDGLDLLREVGSDLMAGCAARIRRNAPHVQTRPTRDGRATVTNTPDGALRSERTFDAETASWHPTRYPVSSSQDLRMLRWLYRDTSYSIEDAVAEEAVRQYADLQARDVVTSSGVPPSPLMDLIQDLCGLENTVFLMMDEPDLFREVIELMHRDQVRRVEARLTVNCSDTVWMTENTSTSLISPAMFEEFCMPHLREYGNLILEAGRIPVHHMCGLLHALLDMIETLPAMANEAYTTRPLGNVSLAEGRERMPSTTLIGGTNATLWLEPVDTIVETVAEDLANCPDRRRIFLSSAGVLPPAVSAEKAARVVDALKGL